MNIIIQNRSMTPIYEQIVEIIKKQITSGELQPGDALPSVRTLARELKISALTAKKAYDQLEEEGFTVTVHGKGTYVQTFNRDLLREQQIRELEQDLETVIQKADRYGISRGELKEIFDLMAEDVNL